MANTRLVTVQAGKDLAELARELYTLPRTGGRRASQQAVQALLEANPHIADLKTVPAGTPIVVPDVPNLTANPAPATTAITSLDSIVEQANAALRSVRAGLAASRDRSVQDARQTLAVVQSSAFRAAATDPVIAQRLGSITAAANTTIRNAEAAAKRHDQDLDELAVALDELSQVVGPLETPE